MGLSGVTNRQFYTNIPKHKARVAMREALQINASSDEKRLSTSSTPRPYEISDANINYKV